MKKNYTYSSILAPYITGLLQEKRANGFIYEFEGYILKKFDDFLINKNYQTAAITKELVAEWSIQRATESLGYRSQRISFVRQLSLYMNSLGIVAYIPKRFSSRETSVAHILNHEELLSLFEIIDSYNPGKGYKRFALEYKVFFRLLYCCGLRISEGCNLKKEYIDLENGVLKIVHSKNDKDRLVYLSEDLRMLCCDYWDNITSEIHGDIIYFFPGRNPQNHLTKTNLDRKFRQLWNMTPYALTCDKRPKVHSLRHTFVVDRMNAWMIKERNINVMMPYLSSYLGHSSRNETFYYYHEVEKAFQIIKKKDSTSDIVIPEVVLYEE